MTSRGRGRRRNNTWFGLQIQRIISDFVCIIKESLYTCNLLSFSFTIYLTDICEHLGNFLGTVRKAANKTIHRGSSSGQMSKQMNMEPRSWQHCKGNQNKGRRKRGSGGWGGGGTLWKRRWLEGTRQFTKLKDILSENSRPEWKSYTGPRGRTSERLGSKSYLHYNVLRIKYNLNQNFLHSETILKMTKTSPDFKFHQKNEVLTLKT